MRDCIERAFQRLRGYCAKKTDCDGCRFANSDGCCALFTDVPCGWKMPGESRASDDD